VRKLGGKAGKEEGEKERNGREWKVEMLVRHCCIAIVTDGLIAGSLNLEETSTHKSAKTHTSTVFVTNLDL